MNLLEGFVLFALIYLVLVIIAHRSDKKADQNYDKLYKQRIKELQTVKNINLTGQCYYTKTPKGSVLMVQKKKKNKIVWDEATDEDIAHLKAAKIL